jgi:hypothetical protein
MTITPASARSRSQFHNFAPGVEYETRQGATPDEVVVIAQEDRARRSARGRGR